MKTSIKPYFKALIVPFFALTASIWTVPQAFATESCQTLFAGQHIDAGTVCVDNDDTALTVTYTTTGDWSLAEVHLFVGDSLADMPQNKKGNPKIGLFPYAAEVSGTSYSFTIPFADLNSSCDASFAIAAHAVVSRASSDGVTQTETGWADGDPITEKGSWATYFNYQAECGGGDDPGDTCAAVETAFAFGDMTLQSLNAGITRWGWQITVAPNSSGTQPVYAGAAHNDPSKGTYVGDISYSFDGTYLYLDVQSLAGFAFNVTHVYAGDTYVSTGAPGQFGYQQEHDFGTSAVSYQIDTGLDGSQTLYLVVHADTCFLE